MDYTVHEVLQARILEWVAFPFSRGSSQPRDWTQVSHIAGRFFTSWATREVLILEPSKLWFREVKKQIRGYCATKSAVNIWIHFQRLSSASRLSFKVHLSFNSHPKAFFIKDHTAFQFCLPIWSSSSVWREDVCTLLHHLQAGFSVLHRSCCLEKCIGQRLKIQTWVIYMPGFTQAYTGESNQEFTKLQWN